MAIALMKKIGIIGLNQEKHQILSILQHLSILEIIKPHPDALKEILGENVYFSGKEELEFDIAQLKFAIDYLSRYDTKNKPSMIQSFMGDLPKINDKDYHQNTKTDFKPIIQQIIDIDSNIQINTNNLSKISENLSMLRNWSNFNYDLTSLSTLSNYSYIIGFIKETEWSNYTLKLSKISKEIHIEKITNSIVSQKDQKFFLLFPKNNLLAKSINNICSEFDVTINETIYKLSGTVTENIQNLLSEQKQLFSQKKSYQTQLENLVSYKTKLMCVYEYLTNQDELMKNIPKTISTDKTFVINAWIKIKDMPMLEKKLNSISKYIHIFTLTIYKDEEPPVELENNNFIKPFEAVTNIYGMPKYSEPDPTTWIAPFFIIFFGLCLTDAGYGIIIVIATYLLLKKYNFILIKLLNYAGWATIVIGALTGGWFGIELSKYAGTFLGDTLLAIRVFDPIQNPIIMMGISLALGIFQIWFGIACKMYWNIKNKKISDALLDQLPWLYFLIAIIGFALAKTGVLYPVGLWQTLFIIAVIMIIITQSRDQKNIFLKPFSGTLKLYDAIGFLSDTLSYTRLLALGLATAIIAYVINIIAGLTKDIPYIGMILFIVILIGGHIFNLAINVLGSFIHSARLQYVEFFSKFMEGGGRRFNPFGRKKTYLDIQN